MVGLAKSICCALLAENAAVKVSAPDMPAAATIVVAVFVLLVDDVASVIAYELALEVC